MAIYEHNGFKQIHHKFTQHQFSTGIATYCRYWISTMHIYWKLHDASTCILCQQSDRCPPCLLLCKCISFIGLLSVDILFADDTKIYTFVYLQQMYYLHKLLNDDLCILADWFRANKLSLNIGKTVYMTFKNKHVHIANTMDSNIKIGKEILNKVQCTKFLGLYIDDQLKWTTHVKHCK
jgi:hypothetical protein